MLEQQPHANSAFIPEDATEMGIRSLGKGRPSPGEVSRGGEKPAARVRFEIDPGGRLVVCHSKNVELDGAHSQKMH